MKNFLILSLALFISVNVKSQATTMEEFNYLTKGYKIQLESGLDMKKGYELKDINVVKMMDAEIAIKILVKFTATDTAGVAFLWIYKDPTGTDYLCIPSSSVNTEVNNAAWAHSQKFMQYSSWGNKRSQVIPSLLFTYATDLLPLINSVKKK